MPPSAPGPTMKTLDQLDAKLEARTPIDPSQPGFTFPYNITAPGSYYLTQNLNVTAGDAITITASQVTLDLNGFTISSTASPAAGTAVLLNNGNSDITILNGHIKGGVTYDGSTYSGNGFANGIYDPASATQNVRITGVTVSGCLSYGILLNQGASSNLVESCAVQTIGGYGIAAYTIMRSTAYQCGSYGIFAAVASDCYGSSTGSGTGMNVGLANNCEGVATGSGSGLVAGNATNCFGRSNTNSPGIQGTNLINCNGLSSSNRGISCSVATGCYGRSEGGSFGINAAYLASTCYGSSATGTGLGTYIAVACRGDNNNGTSILYVYHYNMPP